MKSYDKDILKRMKGKVKKFKIASFDIETDTNNKNRFLFGGFIDAQGRYKCFTDKDKMIEYMKSHTDKDTIIYATKLEFDYYALFGHRKDWMKDNPLMRGSMLISVKYHGMTFGNTKCITKASVSQLGEIISRPKLKGEVKNFNMNMSQWKFRKAREYNKRDCEITREFMIEFQEVINSLGGILKSTIGGCAIDLFKRKYLEYDIHHEYKKEFSDGMSLKEFLKDAYHGGRTETFRSRTLDDTTGKIYYYYDFNSLYPSCMLLPMPKPSSCHLSYNSYGNLNIKPILKFEGCSEVEVCAPEMEYPILPIFYDHKLTFPIGRFRGVFTHVELREFLKNRGKILNIYRTACYTKTIKPFTKWVNELYALRMKYAKEKNMIYKEILKLILNNLYGKFFQRNVMNLEFMDIGDRNDNDLKQDGFTFDYNTGYAYRETPKESKQAFIIPIFSVYVTAYGRLKLWKKLVELNGLACDTDSIVSEKKIHTTMELGDLKLEHVVDNAVLVKPKQYKMHDVTNNKMIYKLKGISMRIPNKDVSEITDKDREEIFQKALSGIPIPQERFTSVKEAIRSRKYLPNEVKIVDKVIDKEDNKRHWLDRYDENGYRISKPKLLGFKNNKALLDFWKSV